MKIKPEAKVAIMMARGTERVGFFASSDKVETASKPKNDRHSTAAPAKTGPTPRAVPSPRNGAAGSTEPDLVTVTIDSTTKTTMKMVWAAMMTKLVRLTETMPMMLSTVTSAMDPTTHTQAGITGRACCM